MRILEAFGDPITKGGQESFVFGMMEKLEEFTIDCLTPYTCTNEYAEELTARRGGQIYRFELPHTPGKSRSNIKAPMRKFLSEHPYDVVHIHSCSISALAIMAAEADRAGVKKVIVHSHSTGEKDTIKHKILRSIASLSMARHVDIYCACSEAAANWKFTKKYAKRTRIIKNGIDTERFRYNPEKRGEYRTRYGYADDTFVLGTVCRLVHEKNLPFVIDIFSRIVKMKPGSRLLLVGDGDERVAIEQLVKEKGLSEAVTFAGSVSNAQDYLQAMDVFVAPSLFEGFPVAVLEAMTTGLPVAVSDRVTKEIKLSDKVVFLPLEDGAENWAKKILSLSADERKADADIVRKAGFDSEKTAAEIKSIYLGNEGEM